MTVSWHRVSVRLTGSLRQVRTVRTLLVLLGVTAVMLITAAPAAAQADAAAGPTADPCLTGDPYRLAELTRVLSNANPSTGPIKIGDHITAQYINHSKMIDADLDEVEPGVVTDPSREPREPEGTSHTLSQYSRPRLEKPRM